jgi:hypothetical protein
MKIAAVAISMRPIMNMVTVMNMDITAIITDIEL